MDRTDEHLKLLSVFYYVMAVLTALFSLIPVVHVVMGAILASGSLPSSGGAGPPPTAIGWLFVALGGGIILVGETLAVLTFLAGRWLVEKRNFVFCAVIAVLHCMHFPMGTALGVFTLVVLLRPGVRAMFEQSKPAYGDPAFYG